jgi:pimeloyl-ACP methyl ester carboxylesterase
MCHGLGGDKVGRFRSSVALAARLAESAIASVRFDFRGSGDSGGDFSEITLERCIHDVEMVYEWIRHHPLLDHSRCGLMGRSFGGVVAIAAAPRISCRSLGVLSPLFDLNSLDIKTNLAHCTFDEHCGKLLFHGEPMSDLFLLQMQSFDMPRAMQAVGAVPFLHISSGNDSVVGRYHTEKFRTARQSSFGPTKFVELVLSDHECSDYADRQKVLQESSQWFISHL